MSSLSGMSCALSLPVHMQAVAEEERQLLQYLHLKVPAHRCHPSLTLLTRNEIIAMARELMLPGDWTSFCAYIYVDEIARSAQRDSIIGFPAPSYMALTNMPEAETLAEHFLQEGSGSLWSAVREVTRCLQFEEDPREVAQGQTFRLGLCSKGGILGVTRTTKTHVSVSKLLNAAVLSTYRQHRWTSLSVNLNNGLEPHHDRGNAPGSSLLIGLTHHRDGGLWIEDRFGGTVVSAEGQQVRGTVFATQAQAVLFAGRNRMHCSMPWKDCRCILVAYTVRPHANMTPEQRALLDDAGFIPPDSCAEGPATVPQGQRLMEQYFRCRG